MNDTPVVAPTPRATPAEVLLIGGRAGVGETTVGWEVSALLREAAVPHAVIEGDFMGQVHPAPDGDPHRSHITERNLTAIWSHYAQLGYRRLIYTNTVSVLPENTAMFERAIGKGTRIVRVLLTASDASTADRLTARELGSELEHELKSSARKARLLDERASADTIRVATDGRSVPDIAAGVLAATGWAGRAPASLRGASVLLRPTTDADIATLDRIVREPAVAAWWSAPDDYDDMLAIVLDGDVIGAIQYAEETDPEYRHASIDIFLTSALHGRGLGTDAVRTLARWLIDERGHHRLTIAPAAANTAAIRSYRKVGFKTVGIMRAYGRDYRTGGWADGLLMDLLADELT
jgi:RimJ/RimL family protein N-acetyltransferase